MSRTGSAVLTFQRSLGTLNADIFIDMLTPEQRLFYI